MQGNYVNMQEIIISYTGMQDIYVCLQDDRNQQQCIDNQL